jgi:DNA-directed RNA polymerase subunit RPC12/RpoP
MEIVSNNKKYKCARCRKEINQRRKVKWSAKHHLHISCAYDWALSKFKEWREIKNKLSHYKKQILIENLK